MIKVLFFAQVRELVGTDATEVAADFPTVEALRQHMAAQSDRWALALEDGKLLAFSYAERLRTNNNFGFCHLNLRLPAGRKLLRRRQSADGQNSPASG